ncbi:MAG TPA: hypothetical protein VGA36_05940 [Nitriliruptorales bacterium]
MRRKWMAFVAIGALVAVVPVATAGAEGASRSDCGAPAMGDGLPAWLVNPLAQSQLDEVGLIVGEVEGVVQQTIDDTAEAAVVLYDSMRTDAETVRAAVDQALSRGRAALADWREQHARWLDAVAHGRGGLSPEERQTLLQPRSEPDKAPDQELTVDVRPACGITRDLQTIEAAVKEGTWLAAANLDHHPPMTLWTNHSTGVVRVRLDRDDPTAPTTAATLVSMFGDRIAIEFTDMPEQLAGSRASDSSPHYGGARIVSRISGGGCSSGYAADRDGGRWMTSAEHCGTPGKKDEFDSGPYYFGTKWHWRGYPYDMMLIGSGWQKYTRILHTNPSSPSTRLVTARRGNSVGTPVCTSGASMGNVCGSKVYETGVTEWLVVPETGGWRQYDDLVYAKQTSGVNAAMKGDSGGPVWSNANVGWNEAGVHGLIVAGYKHGSPEFWYYSQYRVEVETGGAVARACCDNTSW